MVYDAYSAGEEKVLGNIYNYLFYKKHGELGKAGIISLISGNGKIFELNTAKFSMQDIVENFEKVL